MGEEEKGGQIPPSLYPEGQWEESEQREWGDVGGWMVDGWGEGAMLVSVYL